jgi:two-component system, cell cycle response regulator CpdR
MRSWGAGDNPADVLEGWMARILLADDEAFTRDLVQKALTADGHHVVTAEDGADALAALKADPAGFDLLLSDIQMPIMDGFSLAEQATALSPTLALILMSGFADGFQRADALKPRLTAVLTKPVALDALRAAVRTALGG